MNTVAEVMAELEARRGSAPDPGVSAARRPGGPPRRQRGRHEGHRHEDQGPELACELYACGNPDAMYLAGLVADGSRMSRAQLDEWARGATWQMISEYTVPGVASRSCHARDLANRWIDSGNEAVASSGWNTYVGILADTRDEELDLDEIEALLERIETDIDSAPNRVRYTMNGFVTAVGAFVLPLIERAKEAARRLGRVEVDMNGTSCKVPLATVYIEKIERAGRAGRKRRVRR